MKKRTCVIGWTKQMQRLQERATAMFRRGNHELANKLSNTANEMHRMRKDWIKNRSKA